MAPFRPSQVVQKVSQLLAQSNQNLILVLDRLCNFFTSDITPETRPSRLTVEKGDKLLPCTLGAESKSNGAEAVDGVQAEENIVVLRRSEHIARSEITRASSPPYLELVDEDGNGIKPIARVGLFGHDRSYS